MLESNRGVALDTGPLLGDSMTTVLKGEKTLWRVILRLRIPGTVPGGYPEYPDQLRGGFLTVGVTS